MRYSILTGEHIYEQIKYKLLELNQYDTSLKELKGKGTQYMPYVLLQKERDKLQKKLNEMCEREYK